MGQRSEEGIMPSNKTPNQALSTVRGKACGRTHTLSSHTLPWGEPRVEPESSLPAYLLHTRAAFRGQPAAGA